MFSFLGHLLSVCIVQLRFCRASNKPILCSKTERPSSASSVKFNSSPVVLFRFYSLKLGVNKTSRYYRSILFYRVVITSFYSLFSLEVHQYEVATFPKRSEIRVVKFYNRG